MKRMQNIIYVYLRAKLWTFTSKYLLQQTNTRRKKTLFLITINIDIYNIYVDS